MQSEVELVWFVRRCCIFVFTVLIISVIGSKVYASQQNAWTGNVNLFLGAKNLENEWEPLDEQGEVGIEVDFKQKSWPVSIAIDFLHGSDDETIWGFEWESETSELNLGVRKIWDQFPHVRPFIGGGISFIRGELSGPVSDDDSAIGIWFGGGVYWTLVEHFNIGLEAKYSTADDITLFGFDFDPGGKHFGVLIGYHW